MNNPPAFPCPVGHIECSHPTGMTLRDYFAACALTAIFRGAFIAAAAGRPIPNSDVVKEAFQIADLMLAEREKQSQK